MTTENEPQYVTRADCPRNPCQWPDAHTHWLHDLEDDPRPKWRKRLTAKDLTEYPS